MNSKNLTLVKNQLRAVWYKVKSHNKKIALNVAVIGVLFFLFSQRELSFQVSLGLPSALSSNSIKSSKTQQASIIPTPSDWWDDIKEKQPTIEDELNLANTATAVGAALTENQKKEAAKFSNLGFALNPGLAKKLGVSPEVVKFKKQKCLSYIEKYAPIAIEEMELYGIPASITLAQGLVESNAGDSRLSVNENNHFGIKCKSKCLGCRCANYTDDDKYDMFRIFESPWYSFREHSKLLTGKRYKHLLKLDITDYKNWAHGLQAAGYATNKKYGKTLISVVEKLELGKYDRVK
ncbi:MAG: glucosaminidase domain-containing protein [Flavobacteriaceae bacterium]|nr:glucosaminidase domain-containing protein [Flavobacteriaceae bacterium]